MKILILLAFFSAALLAHEGHTHNPASDEMQEAAKTFLASLNETQKSAAKIAFDDDERENWHYFPMARGGVRLDTLRPYQKQLAYALLATGLSQKGFLTATQIMTLEHILLNRRNQSEDQDPQEYYLAIFGEPTDHKPWGWRFEGHHLSLNFTLPSDQVVGVPMFFGTNPAELKTGPLKGLRPLGEIEDLARDFAQKLVDAKLSPVFSEKPPRDILTGQERVAQPQKSAGVTSDQMDSEQLKQLMGIIDAVLEFKRKEVSTDTVREIHANQRDKMHFAWGGSLKAKEPHYFRIQGTNFLVEYANTQGGANHAHLVWRDLKNDFARDLLREHLEKDH